MLLICLILVGLFLFLIVMVVVSFHCNSPIIDFVMKYVALTMILAFNVAAIGIPLYLLLTSKDVGVGGWVAYSVWVLFIIIANVDNIQKGRSFQSGVVLSPRPYVVWKKINKINWKKEGF